MPSQRPASGKTHRCLRRVTPLLHSTPMLTDARPGPVPNPGPALLRAPTPELALPSAPVRNLLPAPAWAWPPISASARSSTPASYITTLLSRPLFKPPPPPPNHSLRAFRSLLYVHISATALPLCPFFLSTECLGTCCRQREKGEMVTCCQGPQVRIASASALGKRGVHHHLPLCECIIPLTTATASRVQLTRLYLYQVFRPPNTAL